MMLWLHFLSLLIITVSGVTPVNLTDDKPTYTWTPTAPDKLTIEAEEGYQTEVVIQTLDLDGASGDFLSIKCDDVTNDLWFSYLLVTPVSYFYNSNNIVATYTSSNSSNKLSVQFSRKGHALTTTTTQTTSTTEALPTPKKEEEDTITVFLYGKKASQFDEAAVDNLKQSLTSMAQEYCSVQDCPLNGTISTNNINIKKLEKCSVLWENYDSCVSLSFAVPVNILEKHSDDILWMDYQLNQAHLKIMWGTYAEDYMKKLDLSFYPVPNIESIFTHKLILFSFAIAFFVIAIIIVQSLRNKFAKKRKTDDAAHLTEFDSDNRVSGTSLTEHYLQQVPPLFSTDFPLYSDKKNHSDGYGELNESYSDNEKHVTERNINGTVTIIGDLEEIEDSGA